MPGPGEIWLDSDFFGDKTKRKYLLVLAVEGGDIVFRYLTSQQYGRPEDPACYHGDPYQGFYLGVLGGPLQKKSWLDLTEEDDLDTVVFARMERANQLVRVMSLPQGQFCAALRCVERSGNTQTLQRKRIGNVIAKLNCP